MKNSSFYIPSFSAFSRGNTKRSGFFNFIGIDTPTPDPGPIADDSGATTQVVSATFDQDFSTLDCKQLAAIISQIENIMMSARLTIAGQAYYQHRLNGAKIAYAACSNNTTTSTDTGTGTGTGTTVVVPGLIPVLPVINNPSTGAIASFNPGAGGGGGATDTAKKDFNWWWLVAGGLLAIAAYQTNKAA